MKSLEELSWEERQFALVRGVLAGNVFDWGAKAVSEWVELMAFISCELAGWVVALFCLIVHSLIGSACIFMLQQNWTGSFSATVVMGLATLLCFDKLATLRQHELKTTKIKITPNKEWNCIPVILREFYVSVAVWSLKWVCSPSITAILSFNCLKVSCGLIFLSRTAL